MAQTCYRYSRLVMLLAWTVMVAACNAGDAGDAAMLHVLPDGFEGRVLVVFDRPDGTPFEREEGNPVLRIPKDGMLVTTYPGGTGGPPRVFFEHDGTRHEIPFFWRHDRIDASIGPKDVIAFGLSHGTAPRVGHAPQENVFWQFFVGPRGRTLEIIAEHGLPPGKEPGRY